MHTWNKQTKQTEAGYASMHVHYTSFKHVGNTTLVYIDSSNIPTIFYLVISIQSTTGIVELEF